MIEKIRAVLATLRHTFRANMSRIVIGAVVLSIGAFCFFWIEFVEVSAIPLGALLGSILVGGRYAIDRYGFGKIDTIAVLRDNPREYFLVLREYGLLWLAGFVLAFLVLGSGLG